MIKYNIILLKIINTSSLNLFLFILFALILSIIIDILFGEIPTKIHPVVIIGKIISFFKNIFIKIHNKISGFLLFITTSTVSSVILYLIYICSSINLILLFIIFIILLSTTFSIKMLFKTAIDVKTALDNNINKARNLVSYLVSRNTNELTSEFIISATIESMSENITDSYVAPVFYYFIFSLFILYYPISNGIFYLLLIPFIYRISNTLDAMVGYKTNELINIGFFPAKIDDILNFIPSRIAGVYVIISAYLLSLNYKNSYKIMIRDAKSCPSPNSGYTMAPTAGALNIQLVKKNTYILGDKLKLIESDDIKKAVDLSKLTLILFTLTIILLLTIFYVII